MDRYQRDAIKNRVFILGEFSFPDDNWDVLSAKTFQGKNSCVQENYLTQYVDRLTREGALLEFILGQLAGPVEGVPLD